MEPQVFLYILSSISEGLTALGGNLNYFTGSVDTQSRLVNIRKLSSSLSLKLWQCKLGCLSLADSLERKIRQDQPGINTLAYFA
jgi:hypothetical protein